MKIKKFILSTFFIYLSLIVINIKQSNSNSIKVFQDLNSRYISFKNLITTNDKLEILVEKLTNNYLYKKPLAEINQDLTLEEGQQIQTQFVKNLRSELGEKVGYKAGLTNKIAQEKFKISQPLSGVLLEQMLLTNGAIIPHNFGTRTMLEGDLMVRVKSNKINQVTTPEETLKYLDAVIPFVELPDLVYDSQVKLTASKLVAINLGARLGVMGDAIAISYNQEWQDKLANIDIVIKDERNQVLATGNSRNLLGHPLKVVFWLKKHLNEQGIQLEKGDLLSLGTITPMIPVQPNKVITAEYSGLTPKPVNVEFIINPLEKSYLFKTD